MQRVGVVSAVSSNDGELAGWIKNKNKNEKKTNKKRRKKHTLSRQRPEPRVYGDIFKKTTSPKHYGYKRLNSPLEYTILYWERHVSGTVQR